MFNVKIKCTAIIKDCPESGVAAIDWRREQGIPDAPTNKIDVVIDVTSEPLVRELGGGNSTADITISTEQWKSNSYVRKSDNLAIGYAAHRNPVISAYAALKYSLNEIDEIARQVHAEFELMEVERRAKEAARDIERKIEADRNLERAREQQAAYAAKEAEEERIKAEREASEIKALHELLDWVANCDGVLEIVREQARDRLLCRDEAMDILRDSYFAPFNGFDRYSRIKLSDLCTCEYDCDCRLSCCRQTATELPTDSYTKLREIRAICTAMSAVGIPTVATPRIHECTTDECDEKMTRYSVLVTGVSLGIELSREYAI